MDMHDNGTVGAEKFDGSWSYNNNKFNIKLNDGTFNGSGDNLAGILWSLAKKKFPLTLERMNFNGIDEMLNMSGKQYVDSQDSML
jgi:hypothetical protein